MNLRQTSGPRDEGRDFLFVIANLNPVVIDDDRAAENGGVIGDEGHELGDLHVIEVDVVLTDDFASWGNDIISPIFGFGDDFHDVLSSEGLAENILGLIRDLLVIEPFFDFAAAAAACGIINLDHRDAF